jgi:membrane peptidoglycan carboxypeptidase
MNSMKRTAVAGALVAGLLGGGAAGAILGTAGVSGAQETTTTTVQQDAERSERPDPSARLAEVLAPLVEAGTIDQAQADAVIAALLEARPDRGHGRGEHLGRGLDTAAEALGMTDAELRAELRDGQTIAQVAEAQGVDVQVVIDALLAEVEEHLAEKVASGDRTQEEADEMLERATERITDLVNNGRPERGERGEGRGPGRD